MKDFQIVILWSDVLFAILLLALASMIANAWRREHLRRAWRTVFAGRVAMASLVVLLCCALVAVLDSLHFRSALDGHGNASGATQYSVEVRSVLDLSLAGMIDSREKTYSAPFATHLFERQVVDLPNGQRVRDFPLLAHAGHHLADPDGERLGDIAKRAGLGLMAGGAAWLLVLTVLAGSLARRHRIPFAQACSGVLRGRGAIAWDGFMAGLAVMLLLGGAVLSLSGYWHILGTDVTGNDVLYQTLKSIRTALLIGTLSTLVVLPLGIGLGLTAGFFGGWVDDAIQYIYTVVSSIPYVLLVAAASLLMGLAIEQHSSLFPTAAQRADARLVGLCVIIGAISWTSLCRLLRAETLKLREQDYVQAARAFGVSAARIMLRHILPNAFHIILITIVIDFSALVLAEAVLSFVGVGVDPNTYSFGTMINKARGELARDPVIWWSICSAFVFMVGLVLSANLFADAVRDAFDPRAKVKLRRRPALAGEIA